MSTLNLDIAFRAYSDTPNSSNPLRRYVDWKRPLAGLTVGNPHSEEYTLAAGETRTIFSGVRSTAIDGTSAFSVALSPLDPTRYRFAFTGGTNPVLRTDRALTLSGIAVSIVVNANASVNMTLPGGSASTFAAVQAGDIVYLPGTSTGDAASAFNALNTGYWQVLSVVTSLNLALARLSGEVFEATAETVTPADSTSVQAYSAAGVQVGDSVEVSAGFASVTLQSFDVVAVTSTWFEVTSTLPLPAETGIVPTAAGLSFYRYTKSLVYIETDQEVVIRTNADTGSTQRLAPFEAGNPDKVGAYMKTGPTWSLDILNRSTREARVLLVLAE